MLLCISIILCWLKIFYINKSILDRICICLLFVILSAVLVMRGSTVGTDTSTMIDIYMSPLSQNMNERSMIVIAPVYYIYSYILYQIFPFPQAILIFNGLLTMLCFFYFIHKFSDDIYISIYLLISLGFYFQYFNTMRQMLALSLSLVALYFVYSNKHRTGIIMYVLSFGIHITAITMLPLLFVFYRKRVNDSLLLLSIFLMVFSVLCCDTLLKCIATVIGYILPSYSMYVVGNIIGFGDEAQGRIIWLYIFYAIVVWGVYFVTTISKNHIRNEKARLFILSVSLGITVGCLGITNPLLARLSNYYLIFVVILIPVALHYFKPISKSMLYISVILVTLLPFYISIASNHGDVIPYKLFFEL